MRRRTETAIGGLRDQLASKLRDRADQRDRSCRSRPISSADPTAHLMFAGQTRRDREKADKLEAGAPVELYLWQLPRELRGEFEHGARVVLNTDDSLSLAPEPDRGHSPGGKG